jgi:hypothetical protein
MPQHLITPDEAETARVNLSHLYRDALDTGSSTDKAIFNGDRLLRYIISTMAHSSTSEADLRKLAATAQQLVEAGIYGEP